MYDVFFSYCPRPSDQPQPLLDALEKANVRVWRDQTDLAGGDPITPEIRCALGASKALVAFYTLNYPRSRACQQEITAFWLASDEPYRRVLIVNPESDYSHIPKLFAEQNSIGWEAGPKGMLELAEKIRRHVGDLDGVLPAAGAPVLPQYYGMTAVSATRFVGRVRELWELHSQLTATRMSIITGTSGHSASEVRGLGGIGKSLLAREYAIRFGAAYPGGVFWLNAFGNDDAHGPLDPSTREALRQDQIRAFATQVGVPVERLKPDEVEAAFRRKLEGDGKARLWIVDDLPSGLSPDEIERRWMAPWTNASTLTTTRSTTCAARGGRLDLDVLTAEEAMELLVSRRQPAPGAEESAARGIVDELGRHALAVEVAASYLAKGTQSFAEYLEDLRRPGEAAEDYGAGLRESLPTGHERGIGSTLSKSIRLLGEEGLDFLRLASVLAVAPIPVDLVRKAFAAAGYRGRQGVTEALDQADSLSLDTRTKDGACLVHTLVSRTVRRHFSGGGQITRWRQAAAQALAETLTVAWDIRRHAEVAREVEHGRHLVSLGIFTADEADVGLRVARHDYLRGDYARARQLVEEALEARQRLLGEEHPDTLTARNNLALTMYAQGDLAGARKLQEQVLEASRKLLGEEHPDTLTARNNLASTMYAQGDLAGARKLLEQVLKARRELLGEEHPDTLRARNNLAQIMDAQGDLAGARKFQEQVLETRRKLLGEEHPDTLTARNNLASTMYAQGDLAGARKLQEQVLKARRKLLGKERPDTLTAMLNLASTMYAQGNTSGARRLEQQVLKALRKLLGEEHPDTLTARSNLAGTMHAQGDLTGARKHEEQVLEARRKQLGEKHPDTSIAAWNLSCTLPRIPKFKCGRPVNSEKTEVWKPRPRTNLFRGKSALCCPASG